jgi:branched-subunit amino acid aminotransferase/4-amino-4-deoxychorismate lyase
MPQQKREINSYYDWEYCNESDIKIGILSNSLNYGTAVIESIRVHKMDWHYYTIGIYQYMKRFIEAIEKKGFQPKLDIKETIKIIQVLLKKNPEISNPYIRIVWFIWDESVNTMSRDDHHAIVLKDLYIEQKEGLQACFSTFLRSQDSLHSLKLSSNYSRNIIEQSLAQDKWYNYVVFLWDKHEVLEGLSENIFIQIGDTIVTPEPWNLLPWVNRAFIIEFLKKHGENIEERVITQKDILECDWIILSWSATWVRYVSRLEETQIDSSLFYEKIRKLYFENLEVSSAYIHKIL